MSAVLTSLQCIQDTFSAHFVTNPEDMECEFEKPLVLVHEGKISNIQKLLPLLEAVKEAKRSILILAEDVESEALATLVVNKVRGIVQCCAVKAPGYGERRKAMLQDIAILTAGTVISEDLGRKLESVTLQDLGTAKRIVVGKDETTIIGVFVDNHNFFVF